MRLGRLLKTVALVCIPWAVLSKKRFSLYVIAYFIPIFFIVTGITTRWILRDSVLWFVVITIVIWMTLGFLANLWSLSRSPDSIGEAVRILLIFIVFILTVVWVVKERSLVAGIDIVKVKSFSMEPALCEGDLVLVDTWPAARQISNGDIVTFVDPQWGEYELIKRVVAKHGDLVKFAYDGYDVLDNSSLKSDDKIYQIIKPRHYFVVGDNLLNSRDSRMFGAIHQDDIMGVMQYKVIDGCK